MQYKKKLKSYPGELVNDDNLNRAVTSHLQATSSGQYQTKKTNQQNVLISYLKLKGLIIQDHTDGQNTPG